MKKARDHIRLLLADDHKIVLDGLRLLIETQPDLEIIGAVRNKEQLIDSLRKSQPDILLLDITLGEEDGIEICKELRLKYPRLHIIALTMHDSGSYLHNMIANGASGYILKDADLDELLEAIRTVNNGGTHFSKRTTDKLFGEMVKPGLANRKQTFQIKISQREKEILNLIAREYTTAEIAEKLFVSTHTVETHRANLLIKLDCKNVAGLVRVAMENHLLD